MPNVAASTLQIWSQSYKIVPPPYIEDLATGNLIVIPEPGPDGFAYDLQNTTEDLTTLVNSANRVTGFRRSGSSPQIQYSGLTASAPGVIALHSAATMEDVARSLPFYFGPFTIETDIMDFTGTNAEGSVLVADEPASKMWIMDPGDRAPTSLTNAASSGSPSAGQFTQAAGGVYEFNAADYTPGQTQAWFYVPALTTSQTVNQLTANVIGQVFVHQKVVTDQNEIKNVAGVGTVRPATGPVASAAGVNIVIQASPTGCSQGFDIWFSDPGELYQDICRQ